MRTDFEREIISRANSRNYRLCADVLVLRKVVHADTHRVVIVAAPVTPTSIKPDFTACEVRRKPKKNLRGTMPRRYRIATRKPPERRRLD